MEHNRVLMIIVSVAIFFAAVVGVGFALLYPSGDAMASLAGGTTSTEFDPIEFVRRPDDAPLADRVGDGSSGPAVIIYGEPDDGDGEAPPRIVLNPTTGEDAPSITVRPARSEPPSTTEVTPEIDRESGAAESAPATPVARQTTPAPQVTPREIRVTEYWIQLIASNSRDRVEQARVRLEEYNLSGRITTREIEESIFYRLRVGPYDSRDEAEKFLEWLRDIDGFGEAWVSEEYPLRTTTATNG